MRLGSSVYMSFDWVRIWWRFYGAGKQLRLFIFTAEDQIVGVVPLCLERIGLGPLAFKVARLVGSNIPPKVFDPPVDHHLARQIWSEIAQQLFAVDGCDLLSLGPVCEHHQGSAALAEVRGNHPELVSRVETVPYGVHTEFALPQTIDAYFESLGKSERKKRQYELRLLRKECMVTTDSVSEPVAALAEFKRFVPQHTTQWNADGKPGHFGAWPGALEFNEELVKAQATLGRVRFSRIIADGQVVSVQYCFAFGSTWFWELPSREIGPKWDRLSLGPAGAITMLEAAIQEGRTRVEGGLGHYPYKLKLGAAEHPVKILRVFGKGKAARVRHALFNSSRLCLLYGYHKLWYRRLTPRLPEAFRKPQARLWLRFDA